MRISDWSSDVCSSDLLVAERRLRAAAEFHDLELADQIGGGLSRIDDIAFDRLFDIAVGIGGVVLQILDRLFAAPAFVVDAGVDDEAAGAPQLHAEPPEIAVGDRKSTRLNSSH